MLWIALNFPRLPLEAFLPESARSEVRAPAFGAQAAALEQVAIWAGQFTPAVSLQPPCGLLLEIEGSLRLFGGVEGILQAIGRGVAEMEFTVSMSCAPTASAAWLLARGGVERVFADRRAIRGAVSPLPVSVLDRDAQTLETLAAIGAQTIGELLRLPRQGLARRAGQRLLDQLDRALGEQPEARMFFVPPPYFDAAIELAAATADAETLLFPVKRLLIQLAGYLAARCAGVERFRLVLEHEDVPDTSLEIGLATPARDARRFALLVRERLAAATIAAPVSRARIRADEILTLEGQTGNLFPDRAGDPGDRTLLIERLGARLGTQAVHGVTPRAGHRPERAWEAIAPGARVEQAAHASRPLWLLDPPRPLAEVGSIPHYRDWPLSLIAGPERIESGWWDGDDVKRDYYIAQTGHSTLWIYRQWLGGWYLHGIFA